jgi:hypothetical protein
MASHCTPLKRLLDTASLSYRTVAQQLELDPSNFRKMVLALKGPNEKLIRPTPEVARRISQHFGGAVTEHQLLYPEDYMTEAA